MFKYTSNSVTDTINFGQLLGQCCEAGDIICLNGEMGAGKTTFVKGLSQAFAINADEVNSPTFALINVYEGRLSVYHFDLYRLKGAEQIGSIGYEDFLYGDGVAVVEWAGHLGDLMPEDYLSIEIHHKGEKARQFNVTANGSRYETIVESLRNSIESAT